jgi:hypothetical protein
MLPSEKLAVAAHLHVLLRRKTGRVTDTEWMAENAEYATAIIRFARQRAAEDGHADLADWARKLEQALGLGGATDASAAPAATSLPAAGATEPAGQALPRYVRGIR